MTGDLLRDLREIASVTLPDEQFPLVSLLIPGYNCSLALTHTLDSVIAQDYPRLEIIVIDAGSTDRTMEVIQGASKPIQLILASSNATYRMVNLGIAAANGEYLNILLPGDFYIHPKVLRQMMTLALLEKWPDLVYCATLLRDHRTEVKFLYRQLSLALLQKGQQPSALQACWFRKNLFAKIGYFRTDFTQRGGFELFCRFCTNPSLRYASLKKALVDYDVRWVTSSMVIRHFLETRKVLSLYFGRTAIFRWLWRQKDVKRLVKLWINHFRLAFVEKK